MPKSLKPFIPSWLDDAGLTPAQFRVYCHIARRGACWESLPSFARCCKMDREGVQKAIRELESKGWISKRRTGRTMLLKTLTTQRENPLSVSGKTRYQIARKPATKVYP